MLWQDIVLTATNIVFGVSLIPQVYHGFKAKVGPIKLHTSIPTFVGLYVVTFTFVTLSLYFSAISAFFTGTLWLLLFLQRVWYHRGEDGQMT